MDGKDHVQVLRGMRVNKHVNKLRLEYQKAIKRQGADFFMLTADYTHDIALFLSQPDRRIFQPDRVYSNRVPIAGVSSASRQGLALALDEKVLAAYFANHEVPQRHLASLLDVIGRVLGGTPSQLALEDAPWGKGWLF